LKFLGAPFRAAKQRVSVFCRDVAHGPVQLPHMPLIAGPFEPRLCLGGNNAERLLDILLDAVLGQGKQQVEQQCLEGVS